MKNRKISRKDVPGTYKRFVGRFPRLAEAHEKIASVVEKAGPLDSKTLSLIKIGICLGGDLCGTPRGIGAGR